MDKVPAVIAEADLFRQTIDRAGKGLRTRFYIEIYGGAEVARPSNLLALKGSSRLMPGVGDSLLQLLDRLVDKQDGLRAVAR